MIEKKLLERFKEGISTAATVLPERDSITNSFSEFRKQIMGRCSKPFLREVEKMLQYEQSGLILLPRGFGKSTTLVDYSNWAVGNNRDIRVVIATNALRLGMEWLREIEDCMLNNAKYRDCYGNLVPSSRTLTWTDTEKIVLGRSPSATHTTLYVISAGGTALGKRADVILVDDLIEPESGIPSQIELRKASEWFWKVLYPILEPQGKIFVFGTKWSDDDLYSELIKRGWNTLVVEALDDRDESSWPERFSTEELHRRRQNMGSIMFNLQYQNKITSGRLLKEDWLQVECNVPDEIDIFQGVDPCITPSSASDYFAEFTIGVDKSKIYLLDLIRMRLSLSEQIEVIKNQAIKWNPRLIAIESNAAQLFLKEYLEASSLLPVRGVQSRSSKLNRFLPLAAIFEGGRAFVKGVMVNNQPVIDPKFNSFVQEWLAFPHGKHDDTLDALEKAISVASFGVSAAYVEQEISEEIYRPEIAGRTLSGLVPRRKFEPMFRR